MIAIREELWQAAVFETAKLACNTMAVLSMDHLSDWIGIQPR